MANDEFSAERRRRADRYTDLLQSLVLAKQLIERNRVVVSILMAQCRVPDGERGATLSDIDDVMTIIDHAIDSCNRTAQPDTIVGGDTRRG